MFQCCLECFSVAPRWCICIYRPICGCQLSCFSCALFLHCDAAYILLIRFVPFWGVLSLHWPKARKAWNQSIYEIYSSLRIILWHEDWVSRQIVGFIRSVWFMSIEFGGMTTRWPPISAVCHTTNMEKTTEPCEYFSMVAISRFKKTKNLHGIIIISRYSIVYYFSSAFLILFIPRPPAKDL